MLMGERIDSRHACLHTVHTAHSRHDSLNSIRNVNRRSMPPPSTIFSEFVLYWISSDVAPVKNAIECRIRQALLSAPDPPPHNPALAVSRRKMWNPFRRRPMAAYVHLQDHCAYESMLLVVPTTVMTMMINRFAHLVV